MASLPMRFVSTWTDVSGGWVDCAQTVSSNPERATSTGTAWPVRRSTLRAPTAISSFRQNTARGTCPRWIIASIAASPPSRT